MQLMLMPQLLLLSDPSSGWALLRTAGVQIVAGCTVRMRRTCRRVGCFVRRYAVERVVADTAMGLVLEL